MMNNEANEAVEMDPTLWYRLPEHVLEQVLAKLPGRSLMRMRSVCRNWNELICCRGLCPPPLDNSLLLCTYVGQPYHLILKWLNLRRSSWDIRLLSLYRFNGGDYPGHNLLSRGGQLVACDDGILCFGYPYNVQTIVLCNPLTKRWRKLPSLVFNKAAYTWRVAGMSFDKQTGHHTVVVAGFFTEERERGANRLKATQVYESSKDSWSFTHQPTPVAGGIWSTSVNKVVFTEEYLYVLTSASLGSYHFLQIFSMKKRTWVEISVDASVDKNGSAYLITRQDEIYLVAEEQAEEDRYLTLWRLDTSNVEDLWRQSFKRRVFGGSVKIMWNKVNRIHFTALEIMTGSSLQGHVWGCVSHRRTLCFLFASTNCQAEVYDIFIEHDMSTDSWRSIEVDKPTANRHLCAFEPSYATVLPSQQLQDTNL